MAVYELPELDYAYDALEPHIAAEIMELHHSKHHQNYVNGANAALEKLEAARNDGSISGVVTALSKDLAFIYRCGRTPYCRTASEYRSAGDSDH